MLYPPPNPKPLDEDLRKVAQAIRSVIKYLKASPITFTASVAIGVDAPTSLVDATSGAVTMTLPHVEDAAGTSLTFKKIDASANAMVIAAQTGETIDGAASKSSTTQWATYTITCDGTAWYIV